MDIAVYGALFLDLTELFVVSVAQGVLVGMATCTARDMEFNPQH